MLLLSMYSPHTQASPPMMSPLTDQQKYRNKITTQYNTKVGHMEITGMRKSHPDYHLPQSPLQCDLLISYIQIHD